MIYLKNNTETQAIYIPRQTVLGGGYIPSTKAYDKGYNDGLEVGKEQQKGKLSNLNVTANGQYEREDGWNVVNVDVPDLNGSYNEGYEQGKTDGANEQKSKLESISITDNGTYNKEDGYNHIEVNVPSYEEGQADMAAKARVLNVTENGTYLSKFSDPIPPTLVTGVYADGTKFYNYAQLTNKVFNTKIAGSIDSRLEFWYKGNNTGTSNAWDVIIGSGNNDDNDCFQVRYFGYYDETLYIGVGNSQKSVYNWDDTVWHHLILSKAEGLWIDGEKKADFSPTNTVNGEFFINAIGYNPLRNADGCFGMIKIDDTIIIPTADGFKNVNTGELLEVVKDGGYTFTENLPTYGEGELYKTINVNVPDLNGSYDEGKTDGVNEQKSKLETINITVNGTYNREDGYNKIIVKVPDLNGSYDEGYDQGQADIAENAKVLNVTENGVYKTKFSDPIMPTTVTGVYADGTEFYNYAQLSNKVYNTNITVTQDSVVELWYKGDNKKTDDGWNTIFGCTKNDDDDFYLGYMYSDTTNLRGWIGQKQVQFSWDDNVWHHIIMKNDGLWIDDALIGSFNTTKTFAYNLGLNGTWPNFARNANGCYGMIKIDNTIIIPTADGFKNVNTGELLEVVKDGDYIFTKNLPTYGEGEIYKTINVNVPDLNGSYDEGYAEGERAGYEQGQADIATNARVLEVTKNGVYKSKFSDPIIPANYTVTGLYADGRKFYSYAELNGKIFNTKIAGSMNSRLEFWYKGDNTKLGDRNNVIIGSGDINNGDYFQVRYYDGNNNTIRIEVGNNTGNIYNWDDTVWHHLIISKAEGIWIDGMNKYRPFSYNGTVNGEFLINGIGFDTSGTNTANGYFGMIKIDDVVIIPTADGFLNTNTGELLEVIKDGTYTFTENLPIYGEGELYKTINVNVPTVQEQSFGYDITAFTYKVYDWTSVNINRDNITNDCGDRPLDCLLLRNRSGECTVMTKLDTCSGTARLENGWSGDSIILSLKSNSITKFSSNSINSNQLTSIDTGFAKLEGNAITNCSALTDIKVTVLNDDLSTQFAANCFNGLPAEGTITIGKNVDVTITDDAITSFFRTIVGEGWTITIKQ